MLLCRYEDRVGLIRDDEVLDVTPALDELPSYRYPLPPVDPLIAHLPQLRGRIEAQAKKARPVPLASIKLISPVANPGKVVAAPVNYRKHLDEVAPTPASTSTGRSRKSGRPEFLKATARCVGPSEGVAVRHPDRRHRSRDRAGGDHRQARGSRSQGARARACGGLLHRPRHHRARTGRAQPAQVDRRLYGARPVARHGGRDPRSGALDLTLKVNGEVRRQATPAT